MAAISISPSTSSHRSLSPPPYEPSPHSSPSPVAESSIISNHPDSIGIPSRPLEEMASPGRPRLSRPSSSSAFTSQSSSHYQADHSTAPSTPQISSERYWRPTPNVPFHVAHRHQTRRVSPSGEEEERNRWLSEDEGLEGVPITINRRRRRTSSGDSVQLPRPPDRDDPGESSRASTSRRTSRERKDPNAIDSIFTSRRPKPSTSRPSVRRAQSVDPPAASVNAVAGSSASTAHLVDVPIGFDPPQIQHIVPAPIPVARVVGLGLSNIPNSGHQQQRAAEAIDSPTMVSGFVPDFAPGRGGDGIGGVSIPESASAAVQFESETGKHVKQTDLLNRLSIILGW